MPKQQRFLFNCRVLYKTGQEHLKVKTHAIYLAKACLPECPHPYTHSSTLLTVHANCACAPVIYSSFHLHTCTEFPHTCIAQWHVPRGFDATARLLPTCRSTWFARRLHNLLHSTTHYRHEFEFDFRWRARKTHALHTCNQACRHAHTP